MIILKIAEALNRSRKDERGFTLIELLIVIAILAILAAIAIPLVGNRVEKARIAADIANVHQLQAAVDLWVIDHSDDPSATLTDLATLKTDGYLLEDVESPFKTGGYSLSGPDSKGVYKVTSDNSSLWQTEQGTGGEGGN